MDLQEAQTLRDKTIAKQQQLSNLQIPKVIYSKSDLRTGMQGRVQRRENKRYSESIKKQKYLYSKQKEKLDSYINFLQTPKPVEMLSMSTATTTTSPKTSFLGTPLLGKVRNIRKRSRR